MSNKIFKGSLIAFLLILLNSSNVEAKKPVFFSWGGEQINKIADFPDTEEYQVEGGLHFDAGCIYKQVSIFFIPVWNYDLRWCGYVEGSDGYISYSKEELDVFATAAGVTLPEEPAISFWNRIGGKLVFLLIIGAFLAYVALSPDEEEEEEAATAESNTATTEEGEK